jgi:integrase
MASYIIAHERAYKYKRAVPRDLREVVERTSWTEYISATSKHEAKEKARPFAIRDDRRIKLLRRLPPDERQAVIASGAWEIHLVIEPFSMRRSAAPSFQRRWRVTLFPIHLIHGIPILDIHDRYGSLKNRHSVRQIPIHPKCRGIIRYARTRNSAWLFDSFPIWKGKRVGYFQKTASVWLRTVVKINDPHLTLHSLRPLWRSLAREIDMPEPVSRAIMGHSLGRDDHAGYGGVPSLKTRAEWMAKIEPLN